MFFVYRRFFNSFDLIVVSFKRMHLCFQSLCDDTTAACDKPASAKKNIGNWRRTCRVFVTSGLKTIVIL